jgi:hypothetical protein
MLTPAAPSPVICLNAKYTNVSNGTMNHGIRSVKELARNTRCFAEFTKYACPAPQFAARQTSREQQQRQLRTQRTGAHEIVTQHGGSVRLAHLDPHGREVIVTLPLQT